MESATPSCECVLDAASDYLDGCASDRNRSVIEAHLGACPACEESVAELRTTVSMLSELQEPALPQESEARVLRSYDEYFPEPDVPSELADWTSVKQLWGQLVELPLPELRLAIRESEPYLDPHLCDWLVARAKRVSSINPNTAVSIAEAALEIARQREARFGEPRRLILALDALAWCLVTLREFSPAAAVLGELGDLCDGVDVGSEEKASYLTTKGVYCSQIGQFKEGEVCLAQALELRRGSGRRKAEICQLVNLAGAVLSGGESSKALELCREAESLLEVDEDPLRLQFAVYSNLVLALCETRQTTEARGVLPTVGKLAVAVGGWYPRTYATWLEGTLLRAERRHEKAEEIFERVRSEFVKRGHLVWYVEASLDLARIYLRQGRSGNLSSLAAELVLRTSELGADERVRAAVASLAQAVKRRSLSQQVLSSLAIAVKTVKLGRSV